MLIQLAETAFKRAGWLTTLKTGRYALPLGKNARTAAGQELKQDPFRDVVE